MEESQGKETQLKKELKDKDNEISKLKKVSETNASSKEVIVSVIIYIPSQTCADYTQSYSIEQ